MPVELEEQIRREGLPPQVVGVGREPPERRQCLDGRPLAGDELNNFGIGATAGYQITENLMLTASYMTLVSSGSPNSLQMDKFTFSLLYGWHSLVEGARRLEENTGK